MLGEGVNVGVDVDERRGDCDRVCDRLLLELRESLADLTA